MRFTVAVLSALIVVAGNAPAPAVADVNPISVGWDKPFKHKPSGMVVAPSAGGLPRTSVAQYDDKQLDVIVDFRTSDQTEVTTLYLFRNVSGDVPVWFDRIQRTVEASTHVGQAKLAIPPAVFTPAGQPNARGIIASFSSTGTQWKSSAAALTAAGEWYVAIRASSQSLAPDQLLARVEQSFAAIKWPREKAPAPVVSPIADCPRSLPELVDAQPAKDDGSSLLFGALAATVGDTVKGERTAEPSHWCRDSYRTATASVYRPDGATDRYLIAYQDAGRGVWVGPNSLANLIVDAASKTEPTYIVELIDIDRHTGFGSFKSLPGIAQALWLVEHGTRTYSAPTWGKERSIEINSDAIK
jgi:hypothetical protein